MTPSEFERLAADWTAKCLSSLKPKLVFLRGEMGSGKTSFVASVARAVSAQDAASPSFALHTRYESSKAIIDHFDLDRLTSADDLESTGLWDIVAEARGSSARFVMIEWAKRLDDFGAGTDGAPWTNGFEVSTIEFSGPPKWNVNVRRLREI